MDYTQIMSDSEKKIMQIIWGRSDSVTVAKLLDDESVKQLFWKRSTVKTLLSRLVEKGILECQKHGNINEYKTLYSKEDYSNKLISLFVDDMFGGDTKELLMTLLKLDIITNDDIELLILNTKTSHPPSTQPRETQKCI